MAAIPVRSSVLALYRRYLSFINKYLSTEGKFLRGCTVTPVAKLKDSACGQEEMGRSAHDPSSREALPWWMCLLLAGASYFALHSLAAHPPRPTSDLREAARSGYTYAFAAVGQYALPVAFIFGALLSAIAARMKKGADLGDGADTCPICGGQMVQTNRAQGHERRNCILELRRNSRPAKEPETRRHDDNEGIGGTEKLEIAARTDRQR